MKLTSGRCRILLQFNGKKKIEIFDGYYTEDNKYFIYHTKYFWYVADTSTGISQGNNMGYKMKKEIVKDLDLIIHKFNVYRDKHESDYKKLCASYKRLCKKFEEGL